MEAENKLYADVHGDGQGQPTQEPPNYTPTAQQQQQQQSQPGPSGVRSQPYPHYGPRKGKPYSAPPSGAEYVGGYGAQQQQQVTVVSQPAPIYVQPVHSYTGAIIYSCLSIWCCCNVLFGLIGFVLASEYCTLYCFV